MRPAYDALPPADLLYLAHHHDQSAWNELIRRYTPLVWRVARSHRLDPADASDVCQTTWITLGQHLLNIRDPDRLPSWLSTTTRRESLRVLKSRAREPLSACSLDSIEDLTTDNCPEPHALRNARDRLLWRAFATLPDRCQRLLALWAHAPGLTYAQLATALGMKLGSIGPSRNRCLIELRRKLAILGLTEGAAG